MFLSRFGKFCCPLNNYKQLSIRLCGTAFEPKTNNPPAFVDYGIHSIRVTGKVANIFHQRNGHIVFFINSLLPGNFRKVHKIVATNRSATILDLANKLQPEQNVSVEGKLDTRRIQTDDGKHRSTSAIIATELCIVADSASAIEADADGNESQTFDNNCVELLGKVFTDIVGTEFKTFTLATVKNPNYSKTDIKNLCCNRVFVYDKTLFPLLDDLQIKRDMVLVRGRIVYRMATDQYGKVTTTSYIDAKQLYRV